MLLLDCLQLRETLFCSLFSLEAILEIMYDDNFDKHKSRTLHDILHGIDLSPKGSIDKPIVNIIRFINSLDNFVTTSSCSGRISLYVNERSSKGIKWLSVKHEPISDQIILDAISKEIGSDCVSFLKCEAFILHVECRNVECAREMHELALFCGFRESGLTIGKKRVMLAIRTSSFGLELPVSRGESLLFNSDTLKLVVQEANTRLLNNFSRVENFFMALKRKYGWPTLVSSRSLILTRTSEGHLVNPTIRRWGHVCANVPHANDVQCTGRIILIGGFGEDASGAASRSVSTQIVEYAKKLDVFQFLEGSDLLTWDPYVHSGGDRWRDGVVLFGGRKSPLAPSAALRLCSSEGQLFVLEGDLEIEDRDKPCPRWGHSVTAIATDTYLVVGGRDEHHVYDDAYTLHVTEDASSDVMGEAVDKSYTHKQIWGGKTVYWKWKKLSCSEERYRVGQRFFHAACSLSVGDHTYVLVVGGLRDLEDPWGTRSPESQSAAQDARVWCADAGDGRWMPLRISPSPNSCDPSRDIPASGLWDPAAVLSGLFGHTITDIGHQCLLVLGGATFAGHHSAMRAEDGSMVSGMCLDVVSYSNAYGMAAEARPLYWPASSALIEDGCVHHQTLCIASHRLLVTGGGCPCLAFGPHYNASIDVEISLRREEVSRPPRNQIHAASPFEGQAEEHNHSISSKVSNRSDPSATKGPVILAPQKRVKAVKTFLESRGGGKAQRCWLDKSRRINEVDAAENLHDVCSYSLTASTGAPPTVLLVSSALVIRVTAGNEEEPPHHLEYLASQRCMALPVTEAFTSLLHSGALSPRDSEEIAKLISSPRILSAQLTSPPSRVIECNGAHRALALLGEECKRRNMSPSSVKCIPNKWELVGDVLMIPSGSMSGPEWSWLEYEEVGEASVNHREQFLCNLAGCFGASRVARHAAVDAGPRRESRIR